MRISLIDFRFVSDRLKVTQWIFDEFILKFIEQSCRNLWVSLLHGSSLRRCAVDIEHPTGGCRSSTPNKLSECLRNKVNRIFFLSSWHCHDPKSPWDFNSCLPIFNNNTMYPWKEQEKLEIWNHLMFLNFCNSVEETVLSVSAQTPTHLQVQEGMNCHGSCVGPFFIDCWLFVFVPRTCVYFPDMVWLNKREKGTESGRKLEISLQWREERNQLGKVFSFWKRFSIFSLHLTFQGIIYCSLIFCWDWKMTYFPFDLTSHETPATSRGWKVWTQQRFHCNQIFVKETNYRPGKRGNNYA